ncbi:uncharacterized protein LOC112596496 [Melanaphis sacchari]|uniref:uncharacterized protein LOC112596496 n=1 Tax=Melanaphis sacchari TaxID=742174 RepID=UPI000DC154F4|nr:uncharacterized protein LOC112596496 [Melanaphis sacchari]XP_025197994.1 uncharacterized protein LOC112596496 [Melanaphis sacchari]XP_025197995.1 uncharacterized protein LOC112596496 [Melanaphis sacchari]XP_025197996.1 uncharacterized protein LOC112596496 [Melanaphis sacchari]XP_025197998.1 uncharacterized protein LOC112596496 [Melanaphis sacchari]
MDQRKRKRENSENKYLTNICDEVIYVIKSHVPEKFPDDVFTIKYIADIHKAVSKRINKYKLPIFPTPEHSLKYYEKIISLIAKKIKITIATELLEADYFSIYIDSLPDTDESAIYIRYVNDDGIPVKRFLDIINKKADNALQIMDIIHMVLDKYSLYRSGFMGLSYDINSNLPIHSSGLKSSLKTINKLAEILPCSSDSLSSVMAKAASTFCEGNNFLTTIDKLLNFLSSFKTQWYEIQILLKNLPEINNLSKNKLLQYLNRNWSTIVNALFQISENLSFPQKVRTQAFIIMVKIKRLETCILAMFWEEIIELTTSFEDKLHLLVSTEFNFYEILEIYQLLVNHLNNFRTNEKFMDFKTRAFQKSKILHFNNKHYVEQPQMRFPVDYIDDAERFKTNTYFSIIDEIQSEFNNRIVIYNDLALNFDFLNTISERRINRIPKIEALLYKYRELTFHIDSESFDLFELFPKYVINNPDYPTTIKGVSTFIRLDGFKEHFSQISKVIQIALCIPATNCPVQKSSSELKKVITALESITNKDTYKSLLLINMERQFFDTMDLSHVTEN